MEQREYLDKMEEFLISHESELEDIISIFIMTLIGIYGFDVEASKNHIEKSYELLKGV